MHSLMPGSRFTLSVFLYSVLSELNLILLKAESVPASCSSSAANNGNQSCESQGYQSGRIDQYLLGYQPYLTPSRPQGYRVAYLAEFSPQQEQ